MVHHAGDTYHYHEFGDDRYGHRHPFLSIIHEHNDEEVQRGTVDLMAALENSLRKARDLRGDGA